MGFSSEMSSPKRRAMFRTATSRDFGLRVRPGTCSTCPARSINTWCGPFTMISLISWSRIKCWIGRRKGRISSKPSSRHQSSPSANCLKYDLFTSLKYGFRYMKVGGRGFSPS